jgi:diaminohydroxyphosphoribosylaminopyrimidine deaminase / 5-amino-6-(5-phosphoribosylamino)uracil reductase
MFSEQDHINMSRALQLAERGLWTTDPNPRVGCVIVNQNAVVGEGWHERAGEPHAEIIALQKARDAARGATAYVTLEPCSHHGRTPPCCDALIESRVSEVVIAMQDPNPLVSGEGIAHLEKAGINVRCGLMQDQAASLNPGFISRMQRRRPWVRVKLGVSLDGRTAMRSGESQWITGPEARADVQRLRARSSAILTGSGTVLHDDPSMTVRIESADRQPLRVVVDSLLSIPADAKMLRDGHGLLIATTVDEEDERYAEIAATGASIHTFPAVSGKVNLRDLLAYLAESHECNEVHVEAGSVLCGILLEHQLVDEIIVYMAPVLMGSDARGMFDLPMLESMAQRIQMKISDVRSVGNDWRITAQPVYQE